MKSLKLAILFVLLLCPGCKPQNEDSQSVDIGQTDSAQNENQTMSTSDKELYDKIQGVWTFVDPSIGDSLGYEFGPNGELTQLDDTLEVAATGSYRVDKGQIIIRWNELQGTEIATADNFSEASFTYKINKHTDKKQVGLSMQFVRQKPR